jgi:hypothetical protein
MQSFDIIKAKCIEKRLEKLFNDITKKFNVTILCIDFVSISSNNIDFPICLFGFEPLIDRYKKMVDAYFKNKGESILLLKKPIWQNQISSGCNDLIEYQSKKSIQYEANLKITNKEIVRNKDKQKEIWDNWSRVIKKSIPCASFIYYQKMDISFDLENDFHTGCFISFLNKPKKIDMLEMIISHFLSNEALITLVPRQIEKLKKITAEKSYWKEIKNRLDAYNHTIGKAVPTGNLKKAQRLIVDVLKNYQKGKIKDVELNKTLIIIKSQISDAHKSLKLLDYFLDVIFETENKDALNGWTIENYFQTFDFLYNETDEKQKPKLEIEKSSNYKCFYGNECLLAFTVFWNLWHNAKEHSEGGRATIKINLINNTTYLEIITKQGISNESIEKLVTDETEENARKGLAIINKLSKQLGWIIKKPITNNEETIITINVK